MAYEVRIENQVMKSLRRLQQGDQRRVLERVKELAQDPRPHGCEKLQGTTAAYRIRQGDYRIVYEVDDERDTVLVVRIGHPGDVYRGL